VIAAGQVQQAADLGHGLALRSRGHPEDRVATSHRALAPLHELYGALAESLGLVFQGEAIHYDRERWLNADLPLRVLIQRWADSGAPILPLASGA